MVLILCELKHLAHVPCPEPRSCQGMQRVRLRSPAAQARVQLWNILTEQVPFDLSLDLDRDGLLEKIEH